MDWVRIRNKVPEFLKKYRYAILVVLIGLALMVVPGKKPEAVKPSRPAPSEPVSADTEQRLREILEQIQGAGTVEVLLTQAQGPQTVYQLDEEKNGENLRKNTVLVTGDDRNETGLIRQTSPPVWQGAVVVCQGADDQRVRLAVVEAVKCVTGLGADRISVLKMK